MTSHYISVQPGDLVWADITGSDGVTKSRASVVTKVAKDHLEVIYGQGRRDPRFVDIELTPASAEGQKLQLKKPTFFRVTNVVTVHRRKVRVRRGSAGLKTFVAFELLAKEHHRLEALKVAPPPLPLPPSALPSPAAATDATSPAPTMVPVDGRPAPTKKFD